MQNLATNLVLLQVNCTLKKPIKVGSVLRVTATVRKIKKRSEKSKTRKVCVDAVLEDEHGKVKRAQQPPHVTSCICMCAKVYSHSPDAFG